jgi:hypothetical protein
MINAEMYYQESGKANAQGIAMVVGGGLAAAALLGAIYAYASFYIPLIYLNVLLTVFFGVGLGWVLGKAAYHGKVRNANLMMAAAALIGLVGIYVAWVFWVHAFTEQEILSFAPGDVTDMMSLLSFTGVWSIFGWTPSGFALYAIWAIEALIVIIAAVVLAVGASGRQPFCEECDNWTEETLVSNHLAPIQNPAELIRLLESRDMSGITNLENIDESDLQRTKVELLKCPGCGNAHFLTVEHIEVTFDNDGKPSDEEVVIVENLKLNRDSYQQLKDWKAGLATA